MPVRTGSSGRALRFNLSSIQLFKNLLGEGIKRTSQFAVTSQTRASDWLLALASCPLLNIPQSVEQCFPIRHNQSDEGVRLVTSFSFFHAP